MIFLWLFRIKSILGTLLNLILEHWKAFIILAMVLTILSYKTAYEREKVAFEAHLQVDKQATQLRIVENRIKEKEHKKEINKANADAVAMMERFKLDRASDAKKLKELYENKTNSDFRLGSYADWMRLNKSSTGLPTPESNTSALAEGWRECDAAYSTLEQACRITTIDYNELRKWSDSACDVVGCEGSL